MAHVAVVSPDRIPLRPPPSIVEGDSFVKGLHSSKSQTRCPPPTFPLRRSRKQVTGRCAFGVAPESTAQSRLRCTWELHVRVRRLRRELPQRFSRVRFFCVCVFFCCLHKNLDFPDSFFLFLSIGVYIGDGEICATPTGEAFDPFRLCSLGYSLGCSLGRVVRVSGSGWPVASLARSLDRQHHIVSYRVLRHAIVIAPCSFHLHSRSNPHP